MTTSGSDVPPADLAPGGGPPAGAPLAGEALLRPVRPVNAFEETVERLLQLVRLGVVGPGERLPAERELASRFAVSRETLREALRAVQAAGFVETRRGRYGGTFVSTARTDLASIAEPSGAAGVLRVPGASGATAGSEAVSTRVLREAPGTDPTALRDALVMREVLEAGAAAVAARRTSPPSERAHLRLRLAECSTADLPSYRRTDSRLHLALAELSGSPSLTAAVAQARLHANELLDQIPLLPRNLDHSNRQHEAIVAAVLAGDAEAARREMTEHLEGTAMLLRGFLG